MIGLYQLTKKLNDMLLAFEDINVVTFGALEDIDLNKQTIFPLAHVEIGQARPNGNTIDRDVIIFFCDRLDISMEDPRDVEQYYWGNTNLIDVWHNMDQVAVLLQEDLRRGDAFDEQYQLSGNPTIDPWKERFNNWLGGCTLSLTITVPTSGYIC